jgi:hypothetical protein
LTPVLPIFVHGFSDKVVFKLSSGEKIPQPIEIYWGLEESSEPEKTIVPREMLFSWEDIKEDAGTFLKQWFNFCERFDSALDCFFAVRYRPNMYLDLRFLSLAHALEVYHRRANPEQDIPNPEHIARLDRIKKVVGPEDRGWLNEELQWSHEPRFGERVHKLVSQFSLVVELFLRDKVAFVKLIKDTRNYNTHFSNYLREEAAKEEDLLWLSEKMKRLLEVCFLNELGFGQEKIASKIKNWQTAQLREKGSC